MEMKDFQKLGFIVITVSRPPVLFIGRGGSGIEDVRNMCLISLKNVTWQES